ncbi:MAG: endospore germination permease [Clostridia bacterium]
MTKTNTKNDKKDLIGGLGFYSFIYFLAKSSFLGMGSFLIFQKVTRDCYISGIIGMLIGLLPLCSFIAIQNNKKGKDIIDLNINLFGKTLGSIINIILNIVVFIIAISLFFNVSLFANTQYIPETTGLYIQILIIMPIIYALSKDITEISRVSQIILIINISFYLISIFGLIPDIEISNIFPVLENKMSKIMSSAFLYTVFSVAPIFILTIIPKRKVLNSTNNGRKIMLAYIMASLIFISLMLITNLVMGSNLIGIYRYPEYMVLKKISLFKIIERIESTVALQFVFNIYISIVLALFFIKESLKKIIKNAKIQKYIPHVLCILMIVIIKIFFSKATFVYEIYNSIYTYITGFGLIGLMMLSHFTMYIKGKISNKIA